LLEVRVRIEQSRLLAEESRRTKMLFLHDGVRLHVGSAVRPPSEATVTSAVVMVVDQTLKVAKAKKVIAGR
jgi:hypothetical protein